MTCMLCKYLNLLCIQNMRRLWKFFFPKLFAKGKQLGGLHMHCLPLMKVLQSFECNRYVKAIVIQTVYRNLKFLEWKEKNFVIEKRYFR